MTRYNRLPDALRGLIEATALVAVTYSALALVAVTLYQIAQAIR